MEMNPNDCYVTFCIHFRGFNILPVSPWPGTPTTNQRQREPQDFPRTASRNFREESSVGQAVTTIPVAFIQVLSSHPMDSGATVRRKVVFLGDEGVGKSSLISVLTTGVLPEQARPSSKKVLKHASALVVLDMDTLDSNLVDIEKLKQKIHGDPSSATAPGTVSTSPQDEIQSSTFEPSMNLPGAGPRSPLTVELDLWDTDGKEIFDAQPPEFRDAHCVVLCFSVLLKDVAVGRVDGGLGSAETSWLETAKQYRVHAPIVLVGCKKDLRQDREDTKVVSIEKARETSTRIRATAYAECSAFTGDGTREVLQAIARAALTYRVDSEMQVKQKRSGSAWFREVIAKGKDKLLG
ncbi:hypothetical protein CC1G_03164 [Coprinopsis cinerea okayama7|uniref:P-loop containing nucleoside triphosphate hydrolase protein n=1 Tax=Coprinopsis cinerea (strain Okayama-7 / 130 / ATCC MYA-4618 / FGSC 9003) TaxID=240176 RepID=A8PF58_COPC7|nr:hypothetical protein CC1G_03164 [Coprinopsis cinerea okayama7\|eukprot:XP_001840935.2 hypothetical protein CC1G_03164 [Coprinopsis cinerea okayama7\